MGAKTPKDTLKFRAGVVVEQPQDQELLTKRGLEGFQKVS